MTDFGGTAGYPSPPAFHSSPGRKPSLASLYEQTQSMSSTSPSQHDGGGHHPGNGSEKGPLGSMNLGFLKTLTEKKTTRDGLPAKRRGPKPDSKPALTRRQELNRQAQRTHRERKESYIKALEEEVLRLKEVFSNVSQDKDKLAEENKQLKNLLNQFNGLSPATGGAMDDTVSNPSPGYTSSTSITGSYAPGSATAYTPPLTSQSTAPSVSASSQMTGIQHHPQVHQHHQHARNISQQQSRVDYDQAGIDFVLTLEKPCMEHMPWLLERANDAEGRGEPCGHALMASCPPEPFSDLDKDIPFGHNHAQTEQNRSGQRTWELTKGDLTTLLDLSKKLDLDGEITPVMAWGMILGHSRLGELRADDFHKLSDELKGKVRCYGFGAVMEEFEVRDALNAVFSTKPELNTAF
ncbi:BZIP-type transcription factor [Xylariales sp. AK1849]|nr:BZIP-type transcription factor [Xylariales sp. AK1849]